MKLVKHIVGIAFVFFTMTAMSQTSLDEQLAAQYYQSGDFQLAAIYYEKLYNKKPTDFYYNYYLKSLFELPDFDAAEKLVKKQIKTWPDNPGYAVDLGMVYNTQGNSKKAKQQFEKSIKNLERPVVNEILQLGNAFNRIGEKEYALKTFQKGEKLMNGDYPFNFQIARVYGDMGNYDAMIEQYLTLLEKRQSYLQSVQNELNRTIGLEKESQLNQMLKEQLLRRIQKTPNQTVYAEMLIWMYVQQKEFKSAFTQAKALDRRQKEDGERIMALAQLGRSNKAYDVAIQCYEYVITKGEDNYYYIESKVSLLQVMNQKIIYTTNYTTADLTKLESQYMSTIDELGRNARTVLLMNKLAHLEAYYLHNTDKAISLLEEAIGIGNAAPEHIARCKISLGDILIAKGDIWEASLYFSQVEKMYKYDVLGQESKFKKARIYYYTGDFEWAKSQLDVLKGSTSKLIANDALELSLLITDNTGIDTTENTLRMFARADLLAVQNKDDAAWKTLDSINELYPYHAVEDEVLYKRYQIKLKQREYSEAATFLEKIIDQHSEDILADNALYNLGDLYQYRLNDKEKAKELYQRLMIDYPGSLFVVEARKRFRQLRGDFSETPAIID